MVCTKIQATETSCTANLTPGFIDLISSQKLIMARAITPVRNSHCCCSVVINQYIQAMGKIIPPPRGVGIV